MKQITKKQSKKIKKIKKINKTKHKTKHKRKVKILTRKGGTGEEQANNLLSQINEYNSLKLITIHR